jgi:hypothetical protein
MAAKEVKLNQAALKLLAEYSEAEGVSPSEAVLKFIPKPRKSARAKLSEAEKLLLTPNPKQKLTEAQAIKEASKAVREYRAQKQKGKRA